MSDSAGSPEVVVGRVLGAFGLRGDAKVATADASELREGLIVAARRPGAPERLLTIAHVRPRNGGVLVRFATIADVDAVRALVGAVLVAKKADLPSLPPGTFRDADLIGMRVTDARLGPLGDVRDVLHYPQADMLVVGERRMLIPMLSAYGVTIDADAASIETALPDGFEEI